MVSAARLRAVAAENRAVKARVFADQVARVGQEQAEIDRRINQARQNLKGGKGSIFNTEPRRSREKAILAALLAGATLNQAFSVNPITTPRAELNEDIVQLAAKKLADRIERENKVKNATLSASEISRIVEVGSQGGEQLSTS